MLCLRRLCRCGYRVQSFVPGYKHVKSINFIAWNKTCQINNDESENHTNGLIKTVGTTFVAESSFREVFEGPCKSHGCKLNEICLPKAPLDNCIPLFAQFDENEKHLSIMTEDNGGSLGDWSDTEYCSEGHFAIGYVMKIEGRQKSGDDTALNAIRLHCSNPNWEDPNNISGTIIGKEGPFGMWRDVAICPYGEVMVSFSLQFESLFNEDNIDNTAANYVRFKCRKIDSPSSGTTLGTSGLWGDYGAWSEYCAVGSAICGIKVRIQLPQGGSIDDTALNDVQFTCCKN